MSMPTPSFSVCVDVTNPGQFFACCGLLELAHRLWPGAEGWFKGGAFHLAAMHDRDGIAELVAYLQRAEFCSDDPTADAKKICPLRLKSPGAENSTHQPHLRLDWWLDEFGVGKNLKTWAGQQKVITIAQAMLRAVAEDAVTREGFEKWFDRGAVVRNPNASKVVQPFYFDARRYAHALDAGFSLDAIGAVAEAYPAVELLAFIGLQRFRPRARQEDKRAFEYFTWNQPLGVTAAAAVACGAVPVAGRQGFCFRLPGRDNEERYKAFGFAQQIGGST